MKLKVKRLVPQAAIPTRGSAKAIGLDLRCIENFELVDGEFTAVRTGIAVAVPEGHYGRIAPRSGLAANFGIDVLAGVIDSDFRGEIKVILVNHSATPLHFRAGDRIAQLILERADIFEPEEVTELDETGRGAGGFGSTGA